MFDGRRDAGRLPIEISHVNWHFLVRAIFFQTGSEELWSANSLRGHISGSGRVSVAERNLTKEEKMTLRVPKAELDDGVKPIVERFGKVPAPIEATWHSPDVAMATFELGGRAAAWDSVDESLKTFAH